MISSISNGALSATLAANLNRSSSDNVINVEGNKISWPDDGWYEVQSATSHNTMHEGGRSAEMPSGSYHVINHTTGERFKDIQIGPAATTATSPEPSNNSAIKVDGNKISWPDDGWYEVQSATSFDTISEGGQSADLPNGTYNLINHTTGERFKNIDIPASSAAPSMTSPPDSLTNAKFTIDGNQLLLDDGAWYEVQDSSTYQTIFEGNQSTTLLSGTYNIINHTTGEKFRHVSVGLEDGQDQMSRNSQTGISLPTPLDQNSNNPVPQVPEEIRSPVGFLDGFQPTEGNDWGDVVQDAVVAGGIGFGAGASGNGGLPGGLIWAAAGAAGAIYNATEFIQVIGYEPNEVVNETSSHNPDTNVTTTTQFYEDGTYVHSRFNNNDGSSVVQHQDASGNLTTVTTTNDTDATNSPQTIEVTDPSGETRTYRRSPTGGLYLDNSNNATPPQSGQNDSDESDDQGGVSSATSAENGGFGTDPEGEFGGTPTAPPPEPVSQPTTTQRPNGNDLGSSDSDRSDGGGGGVSSSQSAEDGGYGNSPGGEFG